jgi:hypothetical protein
MIAWILALAVTAQKPAAIDDGWVERVLAGSERAKAALAKSDEYRLQILVAEISARDGKPLLVRHGWRVDREYVYPASAIGLLGAVAALEKLDELRKKEPLLSETTPMVWWPLWKGETKDEKDATNLDGGRITLLHEIRKLCLVSDDGAFNRLYELVGQKELNERMQDKGLKSVRVLHRLSSPRTESESLKLPRIDFVAGEKIVTVPERTSDWKPDPLRVKGVKVGKAQMLDGKLVDGPMDFSRKNAISLVDLQNALVMVARRDVALETKPFELTDAQLELLLSAMREYPSESANPHYAKDQYPLSFGKYLLPGLTRIAPKDAWRIYNKSGRAYGFTIENAYVVDAKNQKSFFVTAALYTNKDGIQNDGKYDYEEVADPFLADLGELVAREILK